MDMIKLRNGTEEFAPLVATVLLSAQKLAESASLSDQLALYDLVHAAHDRKYDTSFTAKRLQDLGLLDARGVMHDSVRNIIASGFALNGETIMSQNPAAE